MEKKNVSPYRKSMSPGRERSGSSSRPRMPKVRNMKKKPWIWMRNRPN